MNDKVDILYVDDEEINLKLFKLLLKDKYNVFIAENGMSGLDVLEKSKDISIIFSDMRMPKMNGLEFITKAKEKYPEKNYFILTGFEITKEIQNAINEGLVEKYLRKPINPRDIEKIIEKTKGQD